MEKQSFPPKIFDRALLHARLRRALAKGAPDFLLARAADDLLDRLLTVKRSFPRSLDLGAPAEHFAEAIVASGRATPLRASRLGGAVIADEEALPFAPGSFDLVVSGMALQWVNDLPGVFAQVRRILAPDGLFLACLPGGASLVELRVALAQAEEEVTGGASPRVSPFVDVRDMGGLLQRAGFALPVSDVDSFTLRYDSLLDLMADLRAMGAANVLVKRAARPLRRDVLARAAQIYAERFSDPDGRVRASFEIVWISGWAPHESQQKPAKPGSATMRLENAMKTARSSQEE
ncbi:methyltransferase domain-containing protein [Methylocystis sp. MJC1]|jgi:SAM-dependent methyltransferase|uniref:methyltransferase domain-containing protein n=1 Tax=Methylocystis sp. MJC1 TaxID=2654282 RepID=UPI0013EB860B|nr:methyltransferase domain-containing protein [Methylocystis sp. MJC1]KAF2992171.1 Malonyl-[acyl-carrier protein] O-methyltransferase [Methylocystis sp. MJC1]MBU6527311.1 methyltransferase domain-containing protein [Methylocystis sp. MJC1]UZX10262.1 methyltransferase domain-containing protein [Methylocystis sp. MJC1]